MSQLESSKPVENSVGPDEANKIEPSKFKGVLNQLKLDQIPPLASSVRQQNQHTEHLSNSSSVPTDIPLIGCCISKNYLSGSYNLVIPIDFDDGMKWMLKIPANGHDGRFNSLAAESLTSEAFTMRLIKQETSIPVPAIHSFDATMNNPICCPYILMDCMTGQPLYAGWFDQEASLNRREQFRARALQTIAAAMIQLRKFQFDKSGGLRFNVNGTPVDIGAAKIADFLRPYSDDVAEDDDYFCAKGPFIDPLSALTFSLDRRLSKKKKISLPGEQGTLQSLHQFIQWAHQLTNSTGHQFVLTHPDFDSQNLLVEEDGTLSGIIDWDGVAAVPHSIGCLSYPLWLTREAGHDWAPDYSDTQCHTLEELLTYRAMYAQFIETAISRETLNELEIKQAGNTTRLSILTSALEVADNDPFFTSQVTSYLYTEIKRLLGVKPTQALSDTHSSNSEDLHSDKQSDETEATELEDEEVQDFHCERCIAEKTGAAALHHQSSHPGTELSEEAVKSERPSAASPHQDLTHVSSAKPSRKAKVGSFVCRLGERGLRRVAKALHRKKLADPEAAQMPAFDDNRQDIEQTQYSGEHMSTDTEEIKEIPFRRNATQNKLQKLAGMLHRKATKTSHDCTKPCSAYGVGYRIGLLLGWIIAKLQSIVHYCQKPDHPRDTEVEALKAIINALTAEHSVDCPKHANNSSGTDEDDSDHGDDELTTETVWAPIAKMIDDEGISLYQIQDRSNLIARSIINSMNKDTKWNVQLKKVPVPAENAGTNVANSRKFANDPEFLGLSRECQDATKNQQVPPTLATADFYTRREANQSGDVQADVTARKEVDGDDLMTLLGIHQKIGEQECVGKPTDNDSNDSLQEKATSISQETLNTSGTNSRVAPYSVQGSLDVTATPLQSSTTKPIARNKSCPCGSKRKFKKCCGKDLNRAASIPQIIQNVDLSEVVDETACGDGVEAGKDEVVEIVLSDDGKDDTGDSEQRTGSEFGVDGTKLDKEENKSEGHDKGLESEQNEANPRNSHGAKRCRDHEIGEDEGDEDSIGEDEDDLDPEGYGKWEDDGTFSMHAICVALGNKNLDEERSTQLHKGFCLLVDEILGKR
ncbi:hypothetical protein P7C71_g3960, partial [Lecanoromycetidae sp. Uapishka_2]